MNKFFSYIYEVNWRFLRLQNQTEFPFLPLMLIILWIPVGLISWFLICLMDLQPWLIILTSIPCLAFCLFFSGDFIQKKWNRFESEKVKFGKELDDKYAHLQIVCHYRNKQAEDIKKLASNVFPHLLKLHSKKEVEEKIYNCFRSIASDENLDLVHYFVFELNVKVSEAYRENLKKQLPKVEEILASRDIKDELDIELPKNRQPTIPKKMKI